MKNKDICAQRKSTIRNKMPLSVSSNFIGYLFFSFKVKAQSIDKDELLSSEIISVFQFMMKWSSFRKSSSSCLDLLSQGFTRYTGQNCNHSFNS